MQNASRIQLSALAASALMIATAGCSEHGAAVVGRDVGVQGPLTAERTKQDSIKADSVRRAQVTRVPAPKVLRGLYVNRWAAIGNKMTQLIDLAKKTEVNA